MSGILNRIKRLQDSLHVAETPLESYVHPDSMKKMNEIIAEFESKMTPEEIAKRRAETKAFCDNLVKATREERARGLCR